MISELSHKVRTILSTWTTSKRSRHGQGCLHVRRVYVREKAAQLRWKAGAAGAGGIQAWREKREERAVVRRQGMVVNGADARAAVSISNGRLFRFCSPRWGGSPSSSSPFHHSVDQDDEETLAGLVPASSCGLPSSAPPPPLAPRRYAQPSPHLPRFTRLIATHYVSLPARISISNRRPASRGRASSSLFSLIRLRVTSSSPPCTSLAMP